MKLLDNLKKDKTKKALIIVAFILLAAMSYVVFYGFITVRAGSDFPLHIDHAINLTDSPYSLMAVIIRLIYRLPNPEVILSVFMTAMVVLGAYAAALLIDAVLKIMDVHYDFAFLLVMGIAFLFVGKLVIPEWSPFYYIESYTTQPWHNSTYILMRPLALATLAIYFCIQNHYMDHLNAKELVIFTLLLLLTNVSKPNFVIGFAPVMLMVLIYDFLKSRGESFKNAFIFGCCVLIACSALVYQTKILYPSGGEDSIVFSIPYALNYFLHDFKYPLYFVLNLLFPMYITYLFIKNRNVMNKQTKSVFLQSWAMFFVSLFARAFLEEVGSRAGDGNFGWSVRMFALLIFIISFCILLLLKKKNCITVREETVAEMMLSLHIIAGFLYFVLILGNFTIYYI